MEAFQGVESEVPLVTMSPDAANWKAVMTDWVFESGIWHFESRLSVDWSDCWKI